MSPVASSSLLEEYLAVANGNRNTAAIAFYAALDHVRATSPLVAEAILQELQDQRSNLKLIASENYSSLAVQLAHANLLTDKYAEGYPFHRFYAGCDNIDTIEAEACRLARELFGAEYAYVQPHSGADANLVAFMAILASRVQTPLLEAIGHTDPGAATREQWNQIREKVGQQRLLALDFACGGHLTHGYRRNISSQLFDAYSYGVDPTTYEIDLDALYKQAQELKPLILLAGYSAYPRKINFAKMREIADAVGATFMVDMAHFSGLVAGKVFTGDFNPVAHAHIVTSTTHKTLRGPRSGIVLATKELGTWVDKGCPMVIGGPLPHVMAAKAVAFQEALRPEFREYAQQIVKNAQSLAEYCLKESLPVLTGGTDNHLILIDVFQRYGITGRQAELALRECGITLNRNAIPFDRNGAWFTSGLRLGTPAVTTLGMGDGQMAEIARLLAEVLPHVQPDRTEDGKQSKAKYVLDQDVARQSRAEVKSLLTQFPLYPELNLGNNGSAVTK